MVSPIRNPGSGARNLIERVDREWTKAGKMTMDGRDEMKGNRESA
jgi:hypothetical protein